MLAFLRREMSSGLGSQKVLVESLIHFRHINTHLRHLLSKPSSGVALFDDGITYPHKQTNQNRQNSRLNVSFHDANTPSFLKWFINHG